MSGEQIYGLLGMTYLAYRKSTSGVPEMSVLDLVAGYVGVAILWPFFLIAQVSEAVQERRAKPASTLQEETP